MKVWLTNLSQLTELLHRINKILTYSRVLVEVSIDQTFPNVIKFMNEKGVLAHQLVSYECKPVKCANCGGMGHNVEECRKKTFGVAKSKIQPKKRWVPKVVQPA